MLWRASLCLLTFPHLQEWDWNQLMASTLKVMQGSLEGLRKLDTQSDYPKLFEFISLTVDRKYMLQIL